jgi:hypothetical protein
LDLGPSILPQEGANTNSKFLTVREGSVPADQVPPIEQNR